MSSDDALTIASKYIKISKKRKEEAAIFIINRFLSDYSDENFALFSSFLPDSSLARIAKYKKEDDRKRSLLAEYTVRKVLSEILKKDEKEIEIKRSGNGKPFVENENIFFSVAHSENLVTVAFDDKNLGVDCEKIKNINLKTLDVAFTDDEKAFVLKDLTTSDIPREDTLARFYTVWTAKEARIKFLGSNMADIKTESYLDYAPNCATFREKGYVITTFRK